MRIQFITRIRALRHLTVGLVVAVGLSAVPASAGGLDSLAQFVKNTRSGKASFTQVVTAPPKQGQDGRKKTSTGTFEFQRPGKFRFHYQKPFEQTIVADGQTLWLHDVDLQQVTARKQDQVLGSTPAAIVAAASDLKALEKDFQLVDEPDQGGLQWVRAIPRTRDTQIQSVRVGFKPSEAGASLAVLEIVDSFGQRSLLTFNDFQANAALPAGTFDFKPPAGADVVRQ